MSRHRSGELWYPSLARDDEEAASRGVGRRIHVAAMMLEALVAGDRTFAGIAANANREDVRHVARKMVATAFDLADAFEDYAMGVVPESGT